jgi:hypothetical protein
LDCLISDLTLNAKCRSFDQFNENSIFLEYSDGVKKIRENDYFGAKNETFDFSKGN